MIEEKRVTGSAGTPGLLCWPKAPGTYPCIMILHERYGLTPHTEDLARKLAADGHVVDAEYGCGAHSDTSAPTGTGSPVYDPYDDGVLDLVESQQD